MRLFRFVGVLTALSLSGSAHAYSWMTTEDGTPLRWEQDAESGTVFLEFAANPLNDVGLDGDSLQSAVALGMYEWQQASAGVIGYDIFVGTSSHRFPASLARDGVNSISFASQNVDAVNVLDGRTAAYTQLHFDPETGEILEADMVLNDLQFQWTMDPAETTYDNQKAGATLHLADVVTHELGHVLGLGHSGVIHSTQFTYGWSDQAHVGCDDIAGIKSLYPRLDDDTVGEISGGVRGPKGEAIKGAQVTVISKSRRAPFASALTDDLGRFTVSGLPEDDYFVMLEPFYAGSAALSAFYEDIDHQVCGGLNFSRSFATLQDGRRLRPVTVTAGESVEMATLSAPCTQEARAALPSHRLAFDTPLAVDLMDTGANEFAVLEPVVADSQARFLKLSDVEGALSIQAITHSVYSRTAVRMRLLDADGNAVQGYAETPFYEDEDSGFASYDSLLLAQVERGTYFLEITANALPSSLAPQGDLYQDEAAYVLLVGEVFTEAKDVSPLATGELYTCTDLEAGPYWVPRPDGPDAAADGIQSFGCRASTTPGGTHGLPLAALALLCSFGGLRRQRPSDATTSVVQGEK